ncbi:hypothetical protein K438DRAFT_2024548 [Mycena galopus ATCC 62051]|nr:hypothetical protein K438DRAFT_2024548 [Mycena galopus ATCC 62051]
MEPAARPRRRRLKLSRSTCAPRLQALNLRELPRSRAHRLPPGPRGQVPRRDLRQLGSRGADPHRWPLVVGTIVNASNSNNSATVASAPSTAYAEFAIVPRVLPCRRLREIMTTVVTSMNEQPTFDPPSTRDIYDLILCDVRVSSGADKGDVRVGSSADKGDVQVRLFTDKGNVLTQLHADTDHASSATGSQLGVPSGAWDGRGMGAGWAHGGPLRDAYSVSAQGQA